MLAIILATSPKILSIRHDSPSASDAVIGGANIEKHSRCASVFVFMEPLLHFGGIPGKAPVAGNGRNSLLEKAESGSLS